ncbi:hypothetical protein [uncultured Desulfuromonas sp.]|uniref:SF0329 family protein n=1 Tax=uncultured Desulfuromonas sp. TaxID=181013 RepID=UPI002AAC433E|nr:hypothetical protein [uncultured Desulfuromonas sp.]
MRWSQLRKRLRDRFAESVRKRVDVHQTRYRNSHDQEGELWFSIDGSRLFSSGSATYLSKLGSLVEESHAKGASWAEAYDKSWPVMEASGLMLLEQMNRDLFDSLNLTVEEMAQHGNPLVRGLAILDARFGKRRLAAFDASAEHEVVQALVRFRSKAEELRAPAQVAEEVKGHKL